MFRNCSLYTVHCLLCTVLLFLAACGDGGAVSQDEDVIFIDEFNPGETGNWQVEGDDVGQTAVINQQFVIAINQPNTMQYTTLQEPVVNNFTLEVDAQQIAGNPESSFGILARMRGADQFYRFEITSSGLYMVERHNADGSWSQYLEDWTESAAIKQGLNSVNRLKLEANGPSLSFYVNDTLLHEAYDNGVGLETTIGLDAGTFGQAGLQVAFDNVVIRELPLAANE